MSHRRALYMDLTLAGCLAFLVLGGAGKGAQEGTATGELTEHERAFAEMLRDSHWSGHWYRRTNKGLEYGGEDGYHILEARRIAKGHWVIVAEFALHGRNVRFSIPARVEFVQDTPVLYMDGLRLPGEPAFTVRVVFREGMYSGLFFSEPLSGIVLGSKVTGDQ